MIKFIWRYLLTVILIHIILVSNIDANESYDTKNDKGKSSLKIEEVTSAHDNFELNITHISQSKLPDWKGSVFSLKTGKALETLSSEKRLTFLPAGNYVLMLSFDEEIAELKGHRPFTFSIDPHAKTIFHLQIGRQHEPEVEHGVGRTGADFIKSDPRSGRDYINFELPKDRPELCLSRCKEDPNCDAYSYGSPPDWLKARCWLFHGATAISGYSPHTTSGVIQRNASPYTVDITTEQSKPEE